jgi:hypothetical protein
MGHTKKNILKKLVNKSERKLRKPKIVDPLPGNFVQKAISSPQRILKKV